MLDDLKILLTSIEIIKASKVFLTFCLNLNVDSSCSFMISANDSGWCIKPSFGELLIDELLDGSIFLLLGFFFSFEQTLPSKQKKIIKKKNFTNSLRIL